LDLAGLALSLSEDAIIAIFLRAASFLLWRLVLSPSEFHDQADIIKK
jgi:hypothetical protein